MNIQDRNINYKQENMHNSDSKIPSSKIDSDIKNEVDELENSNNGYLKEQKYEIVTGIINHTEYFTDKQTKDFYCENCHSLFQDFCLKCSSASYILNNDIPRGSDYVENTIPSNIVVLKQISDHVKGIFAFRTIPKDTQFGPFCGLTMSRKERGYIWKIKHGKLIPEDNTKYLNWMQHVRSVKDTSYQNLKVFQYRGDLYFRSCKEIIKGSELLVHYGLEDAKYINDEAIINYRPALERKIKYIHACTFCCIGFSSEVNLVKHKNKCPHETIRNSIFNIITQCPFCKIYLLEREYGELHSNCCNKMDMNISSTPQLDSVVISDEEEEEEENIHVLNSNATVITNVDKKYSCSQCEFRSSSKDHLIQHSSVHEKKNDFFCEVCNKQFAKKNTLDIHLKNKHDIESKRRFNPHKTIKRFECEICNKRFDRNHRLQFHIMDKHSNSDDKAFKCPTCSYQTNIKRCYQVHLHRHSDRKPFVCNECGAQFIQSQYLRLHIKKKHRCLDEQEYKCSKCPYATDRKNNMRRHISTHFANPNLKVYYCLKCPFESIHRESLTRHQYIHDEIKRYECKICKQRFNFRQNLTVHEKYVHNVVEENYSCSKCSYHTNRRDSLNRHLYTHGGVKPYVCKLCDKQFIKKVNLKQHLISMHREKV